MKKRFLHILFIMCLTPIFGMAQTAPIHNANFVNRSKETGNSGYSTSLFIGRLLYTIPIYKIDDPDFQLDIALRYNAEGFKPFEPAGSCGQSWTLMAGGSISRIVQGAPDDHKYTREKPLSSVKDTVWGFSRTLQGGEIIPEKNQVFLQDPDVCDTCGVIIFPPEEYFYPQCMMNTVDYLPDVFNFNFCGYKGRFIINNTGEVRIISGDFMDVDISQMIEENSTAGGNIFSSPSGNNKITIRTLDGYTYIFGGNKYALEYSLLTTRNGNVSQDFPAVNAWHLTQITAPNGRALNFNYATGDGDYWRNNLMSFCTDYDWSEKPKQNGDTSYIVYSIQKECLLQSITTSDSLPLTILFHSSPELLKRYVNDDFTICVNHLQLDSIVVSHNNNTIRRAQLDYMYRNYGSYMLPAPQTTQYNWRYLNKVSISGIGQYSMTYDYFDPYPSVPGMISYHNYYPSLYPQNNTEYKNMVDRFGFWKISSLQGMLREVSLPTGGKMKFTYANHQYGKERGFRVLSNNNVELYSQSVSNQTIGGARIEEIESFSDDTTIVETKTFTYNTPSNNSTGVFYNIYDISYLNNQTSISHIDNPYNYGMIDSHIGYSDIQQVTAWGSQSYKTSYTYDTGANSYSTIENTLIFRQNMPLAGIDTAEVCFGALTYAPQLRPTGKLLSIKQHNGNTLVKSTLFQYNDIPNTQPEMLPNTEPSLGCTDTIVVLYKIHRLVSRKLLIYPDVLEKVVTYEYEDSADPLITEKTFTYDAKLRRKSEISTDSRNRLHFTRYTYPDDLPVANILPPAPLFFLIYSNRIGMPIETISGYKEGSIEYITNGKVEKYSTHQPQGYFYPYHHQTLSLSLSNPIKSSDFTPVNYSQGNMTYDSHYKLACQYDYNRMNRLISIKPFGTTETRYVWNELYPVEKTIGSQTTTYTYLPYVGVSSVTSPNGITTYYSYDSAGRLREEYQIIDGKKQILNAYHYHIKTE